MSFAASRAKRAKRGEIQIDLTPLIDVVFQLLIFFVLTSTFQNNPAFKVKLPKAKNRDSTVEPKAVVVTIGSGGEVQVDGKVVDRRELEMRLCAAKQNDAATGVNIKADESSPHHYLVDVLDAARTCGLEKLGILHR